MPSISFRTWSTTRAPQLDEIENAHRSVGGSGRGRRYATQQINQAYAMLLSSQFQGFCRDLHTECVHHLVGVVVPISLQIPLRGECKWNSKLDKGNAKSGHMGRELNRL